MNDRYGVGSLDLIARREGSRTVLERIRYDGIVRCSRAFRAGDAALIVLSQLGPGVVRGDSVTTRGRVRENAHLTVTSQAATRLLGGRAPATATTTWDLEPNAILELLGEPLIADRDVNYRTSTTIELADGARVFCTDITRVAAGARVISSMAIRHGDRELFYDCFDAALAAPQTVGTFVALGLSADEAATLREELDHIGDASAHADAENPIHIGIGSTVSGVFARIVGTDLWRVREAIAGFRTAARGPMNLRSA